MLLLHQVLKLDYAKCVGCGICVSTCPEEALKLLPAVVNDGKLVNKPIVDFDSSRCTFCGECVVLCPTTALKTEVNGEEKVPVVETKVFPILLKEITVDIGRCSHLCALACEKECPTEAIKVDVERKGDMIEKILDVRINREKCIFCERCEAACPQNALHVKKPIHGVIRLDTSMCPKNCQICVDICPSKAIVLKQGEKPTVLEEFCIYCGACQTSCPERAITLKRTQVLHSEIKSGAWIVALEKLTSSDSVFKEFGAKSAMKLREAVSEIDRF
jgi:4Fe-4S ferredoxin